MPRENIAETKLSRNLKTALLMIPLILLLAFSFLPIAFVILTAFKTDPEISVANFKWLPASLNFDAFRQALKMGNWLLYFKNSIIITVITVAGSLLFNSLAGFAFARLRFKGRDALFLMILIGMMVPPQSIIIPQFVILRSFPLLGGNNLFGQGGTGILDTFAALIIPFLSGSFGIFLCRQFYMTFPSTLDEAAKIDGCGTLRMYFQIHLPLSTTILATLTILKTVATWNDFFFPLIMTQSEKMRTIQLALQMFRGSTTTHYNWLMAATLFTSLPIVIVFLTAQKYFVKGIASVGMKN